jgi:hypothetical protein
MQDRVIYHLLQEPQVQLEQQVQQVMQDKVIYHQHLELQVQMEQQVQQV